MNQTTKETRRRSYDAVLPKRAARCRLILETLGNRELTASEITEELVAAGRIPYFNRNYVAPRLTELKEIGILTTVGRRKATRSDATEAVWARAEPSGPTGQTAAAYTQTTRPRPSRWRSDRPPERRASMERLTHERVNGIKTGYWSAATKEVLVQKLVAYENTGYEPDEIRAAIEQAAKNSETKTATIMAECIAGAMKDTLEKYGTAGSGKKGETP